MCVGLNNPLILTLCVDRWVGLVLRFLTMCDTYMSVLDMLLEIVLLTLSMGVGLKLPPFINPLCGQMGRSCPDVSKKV